MMHAADCDLMAGGRCNCKDTALFVSHKTEYSVKEMQDEFQRGYDLGLKHGIEREREKWMNQIHGIVSDAIEEAFRDNYGVYDNG